MRLRIILALMIFASVAARAEPSVPEIAQLADNYRKSIQAPPQGASAVQLLRTIKAARDNGRTSELIQLCEQLVALNPQSFGSWLQLGSAHRAIDPRSDKALAAGYQAYLVTRTTPEQVEALLLISSVLRAQLKQVADNYQSARADIEAADRKLELLDGAAASGNLELDRTSPAGEWKILNGAKAAASAGAEMTATRIQALSSALDAIYTDVASKLPSSSIAKMKSGDARSSVFGLVQIPDSDPDSDALRGKVKFATRDGLVQACFEFTQELKPNSLSYKDKVTVSAESDEGEQTAVTDFGTEANDKTLCVTGLQPGKKLSVTFSEKLESKSGATLNKAFSQSLTSPDLPRQVAFSGRNFILPHNGLGEIPLRVTNVPQFGLEIYRITDRTLHRHVALGHIGGVLPKREYDELRSKFAERLWSANIRITDDEKKRNKSFRTFLPVRSILEIRRSDLEKKIRGGGASQGQIASWQGGNQTLSNDGGREVAIQDARFEADVAAFESEAAKHPTAGVYAVVVKDLNEKSDEDDDPKCPGGCDRYLVQWFVDSDTGLAFYEGDRDFTVVARSLQTGEAKEKIRIELVSASNRVLDAKSTDSNGVASFSKSITQGTQANKLVAILAGTNSDTDFSFLTFGNERLDLSRLNVDGRPLTNGLTAFVATDRGIYQGGDVIHALTMIRNGDGTLAQALPKIVVRLEARDHVLDVRRIDPSQLRLGGIDLALSVPQAARAGAARITVSSGEGENAPILGEANIQLGQVRPDRARLDFVESSWSVRKSAPDMVDLAGIAKARYLFGDEQNRKGAASDLKAEILVKLQATGSPQSDCDRAFSFGRFDDTSTTVSTRQFFWATDPNGELKLSLSRVPIPPGARPISAVVEITLFDSSGPLASKSMTFPVLDDAGWVGITKIPQLQSTDGGHFKLGADLILATASATVGQNRQLSFKLERETELYAWVQGDGAWQHVRSFQRSEVKKNFVRTVSFPGGAANCSATTNVAGLADGLSSGRYVLTVTDPQTNRETSVRFQTGSALTDPDQLEPNIFSLTVNKSTYQPGETIEITANVSLDGPILVGIADTDIKRWITGTVKNNTATIKLTADPAWAGKQLYLLATAYRATSPTDQEIGPARAIGIANFSVEGSQSAYSVSVRPLANATFNSIQPDAPLSFEICVSDVPGGKCLDNAPEDAFAVAYVVDEGLLGLTSHLSSLPRPETYFFGRKRLGVRIMDNYDRLLLKEGGDRPTRLALSNYTSTKIFATDCGVPRDNLAEPLKMQRGRVTCTIPKVDLNDGAVSIYAVVWSPEYSASASKTVTVRSRVVADLGSPAFLYAGDRAILPLRLENIDSAHNGDYLVRVTASGPVKTIGFASGETGASTKQAQIRIQLSQGKPKTAYLSLETLPGPKSDIDLQVALEAVAAPEPLDQGPRTWNIKVRPPALSTSETITFPLRRQPASLGDKLKSIAAKYDPSDIRITARFSDDPQQLLSSTWSTVLQNPALPFLDQLIWRGMLLLNSKEDRKVEISRLINEIQSLQLPNGAFVPYRTIGNHSELELSIVNPSDNPKGKRLATVFRTATVLDVLLLASNAGIEVSTKAMTSGSRFLKTALDAWGASNERQCSFDTAYASRVLVALGMADQDNLDALSGCQQDQDRGDPAEGAAAAAAFQSFGLPNEAKVSLANFSDEKDPKRFKDLSDFHLAMMLVMLKEANAPADLIKTVAQSLLIASTQSNLSPAAGAWIARAQRSQGPQPAAVSISDFILSGITPRSLVQTQVGTFETGPIAYNSLQKSAISVGVKTDRTVTAYVTVEGVPIAPDDARRIPDGGFRRRFFDVATGQEIDPAKTPLEVGERIVVVLEGTADAVPKVVNSDGDEISDGNGPLLVADLLPSAFEIVSNNFHLPGKADDPSRSLDVLTVRGDLRSVYADSGRWIALVTPESQRPSSKTSDENLKLSSSNDPVEFRCAYLVRVNLAGKFTVPPVSVERSVPPVTTRLSSLSTLQVKPPEGSPK
ncbi:alpha-2-macroglobulin family protein [Bradyrhizobium liaoningense]